MIKPEDIRENSVEQWIVQNWPSTIHQLTPKQQKVFIGICKNETQINNDPEVKEVFNDGLDHIMWNMLTHSVQAEVTPAAALALGYLTDVDTPGTCLMIAAYVQYKCHKAGVSKLDAIGVGMYIFPNGAPTKTEFTKLWDAQKIPGHCPDNLLNIPGAYKSIVS